MKRYFIALLALFLSTFANADSQWTLKEKATVAAIADGTTTIAFLSTKAAVEANPLMPTALPGVIAITVAKALFLYTRDEQSPQGKTLLKFGFAEFSGAAANNILLIAHVNPAIAPIVGLAVAIGIWFYESENKQPDKLPSSRDREPLPHLSLLQ